MLLGVLKNEIYSVGSFVAINFALIEFYEKKAKSYFFSSQLNCRCT